MATVDISGFIANARYGDLPEAVRTQLSKNLLDLFAATIAGLATPAANIVADYAATAFPGNEATIAGRGRIGSAPGDSDSGTTFDDLVSKAHRLIERDAGRSRTEHLVETVSGCADLNTVEPLAECLVHFGCEP